MISQRRWTALRLSGRKKPREKQKNIGFSFHDHAGLLDEILTEHPEMDFVQLQVNYLDWDSESIQSRKCCEVCIKHGKPIIVMEPVKGGTLARVPEKVEKLLKGYAPEASSASWAIRFAASCKNVMMVLSGMSDYEQLLDNVGYMQQFKPLCKPEYDILDQAVKIINESGAIPCTACRYCVEGCPQNIAIPEYFALFNIEKQLEGVRASTIQQVYYTNYINTYGKASDCIKCRQCEEHCPQHLPIIEYLEDVAKMFEK